jgi:hypothetical protein
VAVPVPRRGEGSSPLPAAIVVQVVAAEEGHHIVQNAGWASRPPRADLVEQVARNELVDIERRVRADVPDTRDRANGVSNICRQPDAPGSQGLQGRPAPGGLDGEAGAGCQVGCRGSLLLGEWGGLPG